MNQLRFDRSRIIGLWTFGVTFLVLLVALLFGTAAAGPAGTPTTTSTTRASSAPATTTTTVKAEPAPTASTEPSTTTTTNVTDGASSESVVTSTAAPDTSALGRALANPNAPILIGVLASLVVAFLVAAAVQRVYVGRFGVKLGPLEVPELVITPAETSAAADRIGLPDVVPSRNVANAAAWWTEPPPPTADPQDSFLYQTTALESGLRQVARKLRGGDEPLVKINDVLRLLSDHVRTIAADREAEISAMDGIARLVAIGDRIRRGATVAPEAEVALRSAFVAAITRLAALAG